VGPRGAVVTVTFDGRAIEMAEGDSLAAGLLAAGVRAFRATPVSGAPRGPYCMMGACFDCLVEIEGETVQACMTPVRAGLVAAPARGGGGDG
jgi:predicted molibdopterin-dependent oxidoreductase YjgC